MLIDSVLFSPFAARNTRKGNEMPPRKPKSRKTQKQSSVRAEKRKRYDEVMYQFNMIAQKKLKWLEESEQTAISKINSIFHTEEMNLSQHVRKMTIAEYKAVGNLSNLLTDVSCIDELQDKQMEHINAVLQKVSSSKKNASTTKKAKRRKAVNSESSIVKSFTGKKKRNYSEDNVFSSPPKTNRLPSSNKSIITPKFNTRKPLAAGQCRAPHPREVLVSMSGSPVSSAAQSKGECVVSLAGKVVDLSALSSSANLDQQQKLVLQSLQKKIAQLIN